MKYKSLKSCFHDSKSDENEVYKQRINQDNTEKLSFKIGKYPAFYTKNNEVFELCYEIMEKNAELAKLSAKVPSLNTMLIQCLLKEIQMSNEIEGIHSSKKELIDIQENMNPDPASKFAGQVKQYSSLINSDIKIPETSEDIRSIYDLLLKKEIERLSPDDLPDGNLFRKEGVSVVNGLGPVHKGVLPEEEIIRILDTTLTALKQEKPLISASVFHFVFGYVHPFYDGNGRLGRYLSTLFLSQKLELTGILQLSLILREQKSKYYKIFELCESELNMGDITPFLITFLELILDSFNSGVELISENYSRYTAGSTKIKTMNLSRGETDFLKLMLQNCLFGYKPLTYPEISECLKVSDTTVRNMVHKYGDFLYKDKAGRAKAFTLNRAFFDQTE